MIRGYMHYAVIGIMMLTVAPGTGLGQTATLEIRKIPDRPGRTSSAARAEHVHPQHFWTSIGDPDVEKALTEPFRKVVTKEPEKYNNPSPLRFVAELGSHSYGFVLDSSSPDNGYDLLYFDINRNGDLTDDGMIEARADRSFSAMGYSSSEFPRIDLKLEVDGAEFEYAFTLRVYTHTHGDDKHAGVMLQSRAYRAGEIEIEGRRRKILLLDNNSNGRFDDAWSVDPDVHGPGDSLYPRSGDLLVIDPESASHDNMFIRYMGGDPNQHYVSRLVFLDDKYYTLKVAPAGDRLELTPAPVKTGEIQNPNAAFTATVYSREHGFLKMRKTATQPVMLPEGEWQLISYVIDLTDQEEEKPRKRGLLGRLFQSVVGDHPRYTYAYAGGSRKGPVVRARGDQAVEFPFGPPYKPVVSAQGWHEEGKAYLSMSLVGSAGEVCRGLMVKGSQPAPPRFTITTAAGEEVHRGRFEYG